MLKNQRCGKVDSNRKDCAELSVPENVVGCVSCGYMWPTILQLLSNRHFFFSVRKEAMKRKVESSHLWMPSNFHRMEPLVCTGSVESI